VVSLLKAIKALWTGRREGRCNRCQAEGTLSTWDQSEWGRDDAKMHVCRSCLISLLGESLESATHRLVVAEPVVGGGYYALPLEGVREFWSPYQYRGQQEITKSALEKLTGTFKTMVSSLDSRRCERCGNQFPNCYWIDAEAFENKWDELFHLLENDPDQLMRPGAWRPLCSACASRAIALAIDQKNLDLGIAGPPLPGTLIVLSAEY
jgi:hypothetical protein